jgi:phosphohistidine swiveling domain-containing protein
MSGRWISYFSDPAPAGETKALLGGKGASLKEMTLAGLQVPPGFTLSTEACRCYYELGQQWPEGLESEVRANLARLERETGRTLGGVDRPLLVSVRSGAAASMPGMMDTLLNCGLHEGLAGTPGFEEVYRQFIVMFGKTVAGIPGDSFTGDFRRCLEIYEEQSGQPFPSDPWQCLVACINAVFRSWNSERAIAYRRRNRTEGLVGTAVNVQVMFPSEVSGILFTQDPNNLAAEQLVLEASHGLGEAVVSGDVTPDRFMVKRADLRAVETFLGAKGHAVSALGGPGQFDTSAACLTPDQIEEICALGLRVEDHFGKPMDIEWGWAEGKLALLQSRPIRGLDIARDAEEARQEEILRLREMAAGKRRVWVTHNLRETLRFPTPLTWDIVRRFMSGDGGFGKMYRDFGYRPSREVCEHGFLELICGRIYADPERVAQLFWADLPMGYDLDAIVADSTTLNRAPTKFEPERATEGFLFALPGLVRSMLRGGRLMKRLRRDAKRRFEQDVLPPYLDYIKAARAVDLSGLTAPALVAELRERCRRVMDEFGPESLKPGFFACMALEQLEATLVQVMGPAEGKRFTAALTMALNGDITFEQDELLFRVAKGDARMEEFVERFGHRATGEMELMEARWREDTSYPQLIIRQLQGNDSHALGELHARNVEKRRTADRDLPGALAAWGASSLREEIAGHLADARDLLPYRESGKYYLMMGYELIRANIVALGQALGIGSDIFFLHWEELDTAPEHLDKIEARKVRWQSAQRLELPDVIDSDHLAHLGESVELEAVDELQGDAVAAGVGTGTAAIVFDPKEAAGLGADYILVCPSTDPGWTPLFINARGLVVERGGILSHGAIVARDFGIPAVVCPNATRLIANGARIRVDGNQGRVQIVSRP